MCTLDGCLAMKKDTKTSSWVTTQLEVLGGSREDRNGVHVRRTGGDRNLSVCTEMLVHRQ